MIRDNTAQLDVVDQENELYGVAEIAIREGETLGADGTMVTGASGKSFYTRFANSAIHQNFIDLHRNLTIVIYVGNASAKATTNAFDEDGIRKATRAAYKSARVSPQDPDFPGLLDEPQE